MNDTKLTPSKIEPQIPVAKKQEKSYKEMMLLQKKSNFQKFKKGIAKPNKPKVIHLSLSGEPQGKRENSVLSDINHSPSFQNSSHF